MTYQSTGYIDGNTGYVVANPVAQAWNSTSTWAAMGKWAGNFVNPMIYYTTPIDLGSTRYFNLRAEAVTNGTVEYKVLTSTTSTFNTTYDRDPLLVTNGGTVTTSTSIYKYGTTSIQFAGTTATSFFTTTNSTLYDFGTGPFTIEAWVNRQSPTNGFTDFVFFKGTTTSSLSFGTYLDNLKIQLPSGLSYTGATGVGYDITTSTWIHIAASRAVDGTIRAFRNGRCIIIFTNTQNVSMASYEPIFGKGYDNPNSRWGAFKGNMDDIRISNICRYPDGASEEIVFTPPTQLSNDTATVFLCTGERGIVDTPNIVSEVQETTIKNGDTNVNAFYGRYVTVGVQVESVDRPEIQTTTIIPTSRRFDILLPDVDMTTLANSTTTSTTKVVDLGRDVSHIQAVFLQKTSGLDDVGILPVVVDKSVPEIAFIKATEGSQDYVYGGTADTSIDPSTMTSPVVDVHVHVLPEQYMENNVLSTR